MTIDDSLGYYARHGIMTDPGPYSRLFEGLPQDVASLAGIVHGVMALSLWVDMGMLQVPEERKQEWQIRSVGAKLRHVAARDDRPLTVARPFEERLLGNCRDVSLLLCAMLRHQGTPARTRVGFDAFSESRHNDHCICEYWSGEEGRWVRVDLWIHQTFVQRERFPPEVRAAIEGMRFDPLDVKPYEFLTGGQAWRRCRAGEDDPTHYGIEPNSDLWGLWFVRDNMLRDLSALSKVEVLPWDCWGIVDGHRDGPTETEGVFLDRVAEVTVTGDAAFGEIRALYEGTPGLRVPDEFVDG